MEFDEFKAVTAATVEVCRLHRTPAMIGCTSTYTLGAARRAAFAAEAGADAIQVALPYWMVIEDDQIAPFFKEVAGAAPGLALSIYETRRAKKALTLDQHRRVKEAVPDYLMVKSNEETLGCSEDGCRKLSEFVNVFTAEEHWAALCRAGVAGSCSSLVYWFPRYILAFGKDLEAKDWSSVERRGAELGRLTDVLLKIIDGRGIVDSAIDRMGSRVVPFLATSLRCRGPYPEANEKDVAEVRRWCEQNCPEMLRL
jgi:dihydrodipicolinate synthase/N-acetylneuraminate lyase